MALGLGNQFSNVILIGGQAGNGNTVSLICLRSGAVLVQQQLGLCHGCVSVVDLDVVHAPLSLLGRNAGHGGVDVAVNQRNGSFAGDRSGIDGLLQRGIRGIANVAHGLTCGQRCSRKHGEQHCKCNEQ